MVEDIRRFFTLVGMGTISCTIYFLCVLWWNKWGKRWFKFHKHSYQVYYVLRMDGGERNYEKWKICFKCEKCGKLKEITFWNDKIKLETVEDGDTNG